MLAPCTLAAQKVRHDANSQYCENGSAILPASRRTRKTEGHGALWTLPLGGVGNGSRGQFGLKVRGQYY